MQTGIKQLNYRKIASILLIILSILVIIVIAKNNRIRQLENENEFLQTSLNNAEIRYDSLVDDYLEFFVQEHYFQYQE